MGIVPLFQSLFTILEHHEFWEVVGFMTLKFLTFHLPFVSLLNPQTLPGLNRC